MNMSGNIENPKKLSTNKNEKTYDALPLSCLLIGSGIAFYKKTSIIQFAVISAIGLTLGILSKNQLKYGNLTGWQ